MKITLYLEDGISLDDAQHFAWAIRSHLDDPDKTQRGTPHVFATSTRGHHQTVAVKGVTLDYEGRGPEGAMTKRGWYAKSVSYGVTDEPSVEIGGGR